MGADAGVEVVPWLLATGVCAALAIWGKQPSRMLVHWTCKPLTMLLIIAATLHFPSSLAPDARLLLLVALALSLAGDVALMLASTPLALGLLCFLLAHLAYLAAFSLAQPWRLTDLVWLAPPLAVVAVATPSLWPHLGRLRPAVVVYIGTLVLVAWRLLARFDLRATIGDAAWIYGALGGLLFLTADSLLARRRLAHRASPYVLELGAYFLAQWCIVRGTWNI